MKYDNPFKVVIKQCFEKILRIAIDNDIPREEVEKIALDVLGKEEKRIDKIRKFTNG